MSIVKALFDQSVISTDECFGQPDVTSQEMRDAINAWRDTYLKREGDKASDPCMRMAYVIVHKLQKGVFAEYSSDILDKEKTAKGKWMDRNLSQLDLIRDSILQWMLIGGECWVKPVPRPGPDGSTIFAPLLVHRTDAVILAREPDGRVSASIGAFVGISAGVSSGAVARRPRHGEHLGEPLPQMRQHAVGIGITSQRYRTHRRPPSACSPAGRR